MIESMNQEAKAHTFQWAISHADVGEFEYWDTDTLIKFATNKAKPKDLVDSVILSIFPDVSSFKKVKSKEQVVLILISFMHDQVFVLTASQQSYIFTSDDINSSDGDAESGMSESEMSETIEAARTAFNDALINQIHGLTGRRPVIHDRPMDVYISYSG
jgi:hypothetical protein